MKLKFLIIFSIQAIRKNLVDGAVYLLEWPTEVPIITHGIVPDLVVAIVEHLFQDPVVVLEQGRLLVVVAVVVIEVKQGEDIGHGLEIGKQLNLTFLTVVHSKIW